MLEIIRHAAQLEGRSVSDFITAAATKAAKEAIASTHAVKLSAAGSRQFVDALLKPTPMTAALKRARKSHTRLIESSDA